MRPPGRKRGLCRAANQTVRASVNPSCSCRISLRCDEVSSIYTQPICHKPGDVCRQSTVAQDSWYLNDLSWFNAIFVCRLFSKWPTAGQNRWMVFNTRHVFAGHSHIVSRLNDLIRSCYNQLFISMRGHSVFFLVWGKPLNWITDQIYTHNMGSPPKNVRLHNTFQYMQLRSV